MIGIHRLFYIEAESLYKLWLVECRRQKVIGKLDNINHWLRANMHDKSLRKTVLAVNVLFSQVIQTPAMILSDVEKKLDEMHKLIGASGTSQKRGRKRKSRELSCSFCQQTDKETSILIKKDDAIYICRECVLRAVGLITDDRLAKKAGAACSFCDRKPSQAHAMTNIYPGIKKRIFNKCIVICLETMIEGRSGQ